MTSALLLKILYALGLQLAGLFGIFFIFGFILSKLQEWTLNNYLKTIGWRGLLWTAWIGTPFHELGHLIFALIFRHKITAVSLYQPDPNSGELGSISHAQNSDSFYQSLGNFFIGAGPLFTGAAVLVAMLYWLLPNGPEIFKIIFLDKISWSGAFLAILNAWHKLFTASNLVNWAFWLFLYLSFCIASHLAPSRPDRKSMWQGFWLIIFILAIANIATIALNYNFTSYILSLAKYLNLIFSLLVYATAISLLHWLASVIILKPWKK